MNTLLVYLISFVLSMMPIIELKGAIPLAQSDIWGEYALNAIEACAVCSLGGVLSCFLIAFIFLHLKKKLSKIKFFRLCFSKIDNFVLNWLDNEQSKKDKIEFSPHELPLTKKRHLVFFFCALPLPFTGVWSAGALCAILNLNYKDSVITLCLANLFSAMLLGLICFLFADFVDMIICVLVIIFVLHIIYKILYIILKIKSKKIVKK